MYLIAAKNFYSTVFDWQFLESQHQVQDPAYGGMVHFQPPGDRSPPGGIFKIGEEEFVQTKGKGGVTMYLSVDDLSATMEVGRLGAHKC